MPQRFCTFLCPPFAPDASIYAEGIRDHLNYACIINILLHIVLLQVTIDWLTQLYLSVALSSFTLILLFSHCNSLYITDSNQDSIN